MRSFRWSVCLALSALLAATCVHAQGPLQPDSGPAETMKSLDQIEPRTPIDELPYIITESGSYIVTESLSTGLNGITVEADSVTIDLQGHTLAGSGGNIGVIVFGQGVEVRNGTIQGFETGLFVVGRSYNRFEDLAIKDNSAEGVLIIGDGDEANGNVLSRLRVTGNGAGIVMQAAAGSVNGNMILDSVISDNGQAGIRLLADAGRASANIIRDCVVSGTGSRGIAISSEDGGRCNGNVVTGSQIIDNANDGLRLAAEGSESEAIGNAVRDNQIMRNGNIGLSVQGLLGGHANGNKLLGNHIAENNNFGIYLNASVGGTAEGNLIRDSYVMQNGSDGIRLFGGTEGTRVEGNKVVGHSVGYAIGSTSAFVFRNISLDNTTSFTVGTGNLVAPEISASGQLSNPNAWANFSR